MTKFSADQIADQLKSYPNVTTNHQILENWTVFSNTTNEKPTEEQYFAIVKNDSYPAILELKTDAKLAKTLTKRYESISPAKNIDPQYWIQIICADQLSQQQLFDLIRLAYDQTSLPK